MNGRVNEHAKTVHAPGLQGFNDIPYPLCMPGASYRLYLRTKKPVTCKHCLKLLGKLKP